MLRPAKDGAVRHIAHISCNACNVRLKRENWDRYRYLYADWVLRADPLRLKLVITNPSDEVYHHHFYTQGEAAAGVMQGSDYFAIVYFSETLRP